MAAADAIKVEGLAELRRALGKIDPTLQKQLRGRLLKVAQRVSERARQNVPTRSGKARNSIKASVSGNKVYLQGGKNTVAYYGWLDFGGRLKPVGERHNTQTRPVIRGGRYLYPAISAMQPQIRDGAIDAFVATAHDLRMMASKS
jgi:hypothetical protein